MKTKNGFWVIADCLQIMSYLQDKSIDLIFTDTVWGNDYHLKAQKPMGINKKAIKHERIPYLDSWDPDFHLKWMKEALRVAKGVVVVAGKNHLPFWFTHFDVRGVVALIYKNGQGSTPISRYSGMMPYFCFGEPEFWKHHKFHRDYYETYIHNGFLRDESDELKHPSPKDWETWLQMLKDLNREKPLQSVYDPFLGSGTLGEVCESLGIKWLGTEISPDYIPDITFRVHRGIKRGLQSKLF